MPRRRRRWTSVKKKKQVSWTDALKNIYKDFGKAGALSSSPDILKNELAKRFNITDISLKKIKNWLNAQFSHSIHRRADINFPRNQILAPDMDHQWQADLLFLDDLGHFNGGNKVILVAIDVVSRHAWAEPMKNKTGPSTTTAFEHILKRAHPRKPLKLQTDKGTEFLNKHFQQLLSSYGIEHFTTYSDKKAAIAERFVKTLKTYVFKFLKETNSRSYIDKLQDLVSTYNSTFHSSIKMPPKNVSKENVNDVLETLYGHLWKEDALRNKLRVPLFQVNDFVRVSKIHSHIFRKGYRGNWTDEIFQVSKIKDTFPRITYGIKDLEGQQIMGSYYENELQKIPSEGVNEQYWEIESVLKTKNSRDGKKQYFVKWKGHDDSHNSWVSADHFKQSV